MIPLKDFNLSNPRSIAIPMRFDGDQPNAFGVARAASHACESATLVGDTRRGGSCNFEQVSFIPHCNGTHTECVGHITDERISIIDCLRDPLSVAALVSIEPVAPAETTETYVVDLNSDDRMITRRSIEVALSNLNFQISSDSLIVRTFPNDKSKQSRTYSDEIPPFFSTEAMEFIVESGFRHLLVDLPSIDRIYDEGKLSNHRIFWDVDPDSRRVKASTRHDATVTELIFVPDSIADGQYLLNLQIAPFAADAAPSNPTLFDI